MAKHVNPNSKNARDNNKPKTGYERKGNKGAQESARESLEEVLKPLSQPATPKATLPSTYGKTFNSNKGRGGTKAPSAPFKLPTVNIPQNNHGTIITPRGNALIQTTNTSSNRTNFRNTLGSVYNKLFKGFGNGKPYHFNPYEQELRDKETWDRLNSKEYNSTPDMQGQLKTLQNYSHSDVVVQFATNNLQHTDYWFTETDFFGDAVLGQYTNYPYEGNHFPNYLSNWLMDDVDIDTQEEYDTYTKRYEIYQEYMKKYTHSAKYYNPEHEEADGMRDPFSATTVVDEDAPLPPWVENTLENRERWATYLKRSARELDVINAEGEYYHKQLQDQYQAGVEAKAKGIEGKIGNAAAEMDQVGVANSFTDAIASSLFAKGKKRTDVGDYFRDYWLNPLRTGHFGTFLSNRLFDAMDAVDLPAKGVRAIMAANPHLYGDKRKVFDDQETFVYSGGKDLQKQIMDAGGRELLYGSQQLAQGYDPTRKSTEELIQSLKDAGLWEEYQLLAQEWKAYEPESSALQNLKEAYTIPGKDFYTNTGNLGKDVAIDILLDPTLVLGGGAKALVRGATKNIARASVERGLMEAIGSPSMRTLSKQDRPIIEAFVRQMDPKTVLFKNKKDIDSAVDALSERLKTRFVLTHLNEDQFKNTVKTSIHNHVANTNAAIVATSKQGERNAREAFLRTVYNIGWMADEVDSTLLKTAFPEPFLMKNTIKGTKAFANNSIVGKYFSTIYHRRRMKKLDDARQLFGDDYSGVSHLDVDQLEHFKDVQSGKIDVNTDTRLRSIGAAESRIRTMQGSCETILHRLGRGNISTEEAYAQLQREIQFFAGREKCASLDDLDTIIANRLDGFFTDDAIEAYEKFKKSYRSVEELIEKRNAKSKGNFIYEISRAKDKEHLFDIFKKYNDQLDYTDNILLQDIALKYNKTIPIEDLENILRQMQDIPKQPFIAHKGKITENEILETVKRGAGTDPLDFAEPLKGQSSYTIKDLKTLISKPEYSDLKVLIDDPNITEFNRLENLLNSQARKYKTDEIINIFHQTFYDIGFKYAFEPPENIKVGLDKLYELRNEITQTIVAPQKMSSGAIYQYQLDRMVVFDELINDSRILNFFDKFNSRVRPLLEDVRNGTSLSIDAVNNSGFYNLMDTIDRKIKSVNIFHRLNTELDGVIDPYQKMTILDYMFGLTDGNAEEVLSQLINDPSRIMKGIDNAMYSAHGENRLSIRSARFRMSSYNDSIWGKYGEELRSNPELQKKVNKLVEADPADPMSYVNIQILQNILLDEDAIKYYNSVDDTFPVVFMHCSTSGLNPNNSAITGIAYKKWTKLDENASLNDIFEKILDRDNESLRVAIDDDKYFDNLEREFLNKVYDSHIAYEHSYYKNNVEAYKKLFGKRVDPKTGKELVRSEADIVEMFCKQLYDMSFSTKGGKQVKKGEPCIVVHDYEGFNMPFLNEKITKYDTLRTQLSAEQQVAYEYTKLVNQSLRDINRVSDNSFDSLRRITNEHALTDQERENVAELLYKAFYDMNENGSVFTRLDFSDISEQAQVVERLISSEGIHTSNDPVIKQISSAFTGDDGLLKLLPGVYRAISDINELDAIASNQLLYRYTTTSKVRTGLVTMTEAKHWKKGVDDCFAAIDDLVRLYGISALVRGVKSDYYRAGMDAPIPHINIKSKSFSDPSIPGYYSDPARAFLHEFGHFLFRDAGFGTYLKQVSSNVQAHPSYTYFKKVESNVHPYVSDERTFEEIFVQALAVHLRNSDFVTKLKSFSDNEDYQKAVDLYSKIATAETIDLQQSLSQKAKEIEKAQKEFFTVTGWDMDILANELSKALYNTLDNRSSIWKKNLADIVSIQVNPIRYSRGIDPLQYLLNFKTKIDLTNVRSYFNLYNPKLDRYDVSILGGIPFRVLKRMSFLADYVVKNKELVLDSAEDFLTQYKPYFDQIITEMRDLAKQSSRGEVGQSLQHLTMIEPPRTAVESYLLCKKVYTDYLSKLDRIDLDLTSLPSDYKEMLFVDMYKNPMKVQTIRDALKYKDMRDILWGNRDHEIWQKPFTLLDDVPSSSSYSSSISKLNDAVIKARRLKEVCSQVRRKISDITHLDDYLISKDIITKKDYKEAMLYQHVDDFLQSIGDIADHADFMKTIDNIQNWRRDFHRFYYLRKLMTDNKFDKDKILNELLWNDTGMIVVYPDKYTVEVEDAFKSCIKEMDSSYIGVNYEGGAFIVYIKKGNKIKENTEQGYRYLSGHEYIRSTRNKYDALPFPEYEDIVVNSDIFTEEMYAQLKQIYQDIDYFSDGASLGTLGNKLNLNDFQKFFRKISNTMDKAEIPHALLEQDMYRGLICDPGFISTDTDTGLSFFSDILHTFENLKRTTGDVKLTAEFVFGEHSDTKVKDILSEVSNAEALEYFNKVDDYAIVQLKSGDTHSGMFLQEIKPQTESDIQTLRDTDAVIIPKELYYELQNRINYHDTNSVLAVFNKALVLFKALQLFKPSTWLRNYIDALTKAVLEEDEGGLAGATQLISRSFKATNETIMVQLMHYREGSYISERTWDSLCRRYHIEDMTWEDYQLLSGLLDRDSIVQSSMRATGYREGVISGKTVNFSDLKDDDIKRVWKSARIKEEYEGIDIDTFNAIRRGDVVPSDSLKKKYDETCRRVLTGLANMNEPKFDKAINKIFVPFNTSEVSARYTQMLWLRDLGYSHNQCIKRVVDSQFRTLPNAHVLNKMEMIVPFSTFKYNNAMFWVRMIEEKPAYYRLFEHIYGKIAYDNYEQMIDEYGEADISNDYMLNTGGLPIGGSGLYFKLTPSCLDFFNLFYGGPAKNIQGLNPWLQFAFKYSMYELGFSSSEFLTEFDYEYDMKNFIKDTMHLIPGLDRMYDLYEHFTDKSFLYENAPNFVSKELVKWLPGLFGSDIDFTSRSGSDFNSFQANLAKDGLWFDCNEGKIVSISKKNERGANDPRLNWDDVMYYMLVRHGKVWDANVGSFVSISERTSGGLNQEFDLENDPDAWDRLCEEYKKKGQVYDYNLRSFVPESELTSGGLNDPDISFKERNRLYYEKFGLRWDANQNKYVDRDHYIPGGLNDLEGIHNVQDFNRLKAYRRALYGEEYQRFDQPDENGKNGEFVQKYEPTCVTLDSLIQNTIDEDNYYQYVALPRLWSEDIRDCKVENGFIMTADGKYVLTRNVDYNNRVFEQLSITAGFGYRRGRWKSFGWINYDDQYQQVIGRKPHKVYIPNEYQGKLLGSRSIDYFYRYQSPTKPYQFHRTDGAHRIHKTLSGNVIYGAEYNKFSFYRS